jgi:hypothetical protein
MSWLRDYLIRRREERAARPRVIDVIPGHRPRIDVRVLKTPGEPLDFLVWCWRCRKVVAISTQGAPPFELQQLIEDHDDQHTGVATWQPPDPRNSGE